MDAELYNIKNSLYTYRCVEVCQNLGYTPKEKSESRGIYCGLVQSFGSGVIQDIALTFEDDLTCEYGSVLFIGFPADLC